MTDSKKYLLIAVIAIPVIVIISYLVTTFDNRAPSGDVREEAIVLLQEDLDFSQSLYPPEDHPILREHFEKQRTALEEAPAVKWETLANLASLYKDIRDYDHALQMYALLDRVNPEDKSYKLERGELFLRMDNPQAAIEAIQPLKSEWPVPETYLYLADAYKRLEGTPDYVIDEIYEEGIYRHNGISDLVWEYVEWLEETEREAETIQYYEMIFEQDKDPEIQQKIEELKAKYA